MMIDIQRQPPKSSTCGHHCVAMIANKPVAEIIKMFGHSHASRTKDYITTLSALGIQTAPRFRRYKWKKDLPKLAIIRMIWLTNKNKGHVAVYHNGLVYCPSVGVRTYNMQYFVEVGCRHVSFLKIEL